MENKYKILIIITFLIACFFFARWVNDVRPRYEIVERITYNNASCFINVGQAMCAICNDDYWLDEEFFDVEAYYCIETHTGGDTCYIKEKVRIK